MEFPVFFIFVLFFVALLIVTIVVYLQIYKSNINKALNAETKPSAMAPPYKVALVLTIIVVAIVFAVGMLFSYAKGYSAAKDDSPGIDIHSFYAEVKEIDENTITVEGISLNDEEYRGEFKYWVHESVIIVWKNEPINLSDIEQGDLVCVTLVTGGGDITDIFKIQLLN